VKYRLGGLQNHGRGWAGTLMLTEGAVLAWKGLGQARVGTFGYWDIESWGSLGT